jgi:hypothetical protein
VNDIKFKAVTFVKGDDSLHGHYFYEITLPEALAKIKEKGFDPINDFKMTIAVYPW